MPLGRSEVVLTMTYRQEERLEGNPSRAVLKAGRRKQFLLPSHHMLGHPEAHTRMPAGTVEHQDDVFVRAGAGLTGELCQLHFKERDGDTRGQVEEGPTGSRMDEAHQGAPFEAVAHWSAGTLANRRPDAPEQRLEANTMFVGGPHLHLGA